MSVSHHEHGTAGDEVMSSPREHQPAPERPSVKAGAAIHTIVLEASAQLPGGVVALETALKGLSGIIRADANAVTGSAAGRWRRRTSASRSGRKRA